MYIRYNFNRRRDSGKITQEEIEWKGPYCLFGYESQENPIAIPDVSGVYLFCFSIGGNYVLEYAGVTKSTKQRMKTHIREYKKGSYTIIDLDALENFERKEIWHGWDLAKSEDSKKYFKKHGEYYSNTIDRQLYSYRVFVSEIVDVRKRERIEAALMLNAYQSDERWADLVPRGMSLKGRFNCEIPIIIKNKCHTNIIGIPDKIEI